MLTAYCKCGKMQAWTSGMVLHACDVCDECGSPLAYPGMLHQEPIPHDWKIRYSEDTGKPLYEMCSRCYTRKPLTP